MHIPLDRVEAGRVEAHLERQTSTYDTRIVEPAPQFDRKNRVFVTVDNPCTRGESAGVWVTRVLRIARCGKQSGNDYE
jgi:hypothetical protein